MVKQKTLVYFVAAWLLLSSPLEKTILKGISRIFVSWWTDLQGDTEVKSIRGRRVVIEMHSNSLAARIDISGYVGAGRYALTRNVIFRTSVWRRVCPFYRATLFEMLV